MKNFDITSFDNLVLKGYLFDEVKEPKAIIQVIHGMQEHGMRYEYFAKELNKKGYIMYVSDLRAHGNTASSISTLGQDKDAFKNTVQDQIIISENLQDKYNLPIYIFGHSFGSFITQKYIQLCNIPKKVIMCGTSYGGLALYKMAKIIADTQALFVPYKPAKLIESMSLKGYGKGYPDGNWLSRDQENWNKYKSDIYCGTVFPVIFYKSMFKGLVGLNKNVKDIPNDIKIKLIVGECDPVGGPKNVQKVNAMYHKYGLNSSCNVYSGARHELLNETNKDEIIKDIVSFYNN